METSKKVYIAIIGDIRSSRFLNNREDVQITLWKALEEINSRYHENIAAKFTITLGDEFQGLLTRSGSVLAITSEIERKIYPVKIRFGIGIGRISTTINPKLAIGADGPGYYKAREAIEYLKNNEKRKKVSESDIRVEVDGGNEVTVDLINTSLELVTAIKRSWSKGQREAIWSLFDQPDIQVNVAKRLNIKQPALQKALAAGNYYAYFNAINNIEKALGYVEVENA